MRRLVQERGVMGQPLGNVVNEDRAGRLGDPNHLFDPLLAPIQILLQFKIVFGDMIFLVQVERRIGEGHIHALVGDVPKERQAVALRNGVQTRFQRGVSLRFQLNAPISANPGKVFWTGANLQRSYQPVLAIF